MTTIAYMAGVVSAYIRFVLCGMVSLHADLERTEPAASFHVLMCQIIQKMNKR